MPRPHDHVVCLVASARASHRVRSNLERKKRANWAWLDNPHRFVRGPAAPEAENPPEPGWHGEHLRASQVPEPARHAAPGMTGSLHHGVGEPDRVRGVGAQLAAVCGEAQQFGPRVVVDEGLAFRAGQPARFESGTESESHSDSPIADSELRNVLYVEEARD